MPGSTRMIHAVESQKARMILKLSIIVLVLLLVAGYDGDKPKSQNAYSGFDLVDKTGNIRKPNDFRERYQALGFADQRFGNEPQATVGCDGQIERSSLQRGIERLAEVRIGVDMLHLRRDFLDLVLAAVQDCNLVAALQEPIDDEMSGGS